VLGEQRPQDAGERLDVDDLAVADDAGGSGAEAASLTARPPAVVTEAT
jgi:hypothetical protein